MLRATLVSNRWCWYSGALKKRTRLLVLNHPRMALPPWLRENDLNTKTPFVVSAAYTQPRRLPPPRAWRVRALERALLAISGAVFSSRQRRGLNSRRPRRQQSRGLRAAKPRARRGHGLLRASFFPGGPRRHRGAETAETWTCLPEASHHDADGRARFFFGDASPRSILYHRDSVSVSANSISCHGPRPLSMFKAHLLDTYACLERV